LFCKAMKDLPQLPEKHLALTRIALTHESSSYAKSRKEIHQRRIAFLWAAGRPLTSSDSSFEEGECRRQDGERGSSQANQGT